MKRLLLSVGLAVCPALSVTQQPTTANLSLADALALARAHNPLYRQALHDRAPAGWAARNAWSSTFLPTLTASGGLGYSGSGQQRFLTANFSQNVSTLSSSYGLFLDWGLNGQTLTQIPLKHAQLSAADADVAGAESNLVTGVTQQYLSVLQARDNAEVARRELDRNEQFLKLARAPPAGAFVQPRARTRRVSRCRPAGRGSRRNSLTLTRRSRPSRRARPPTWRRASTGTPPGSTRGSRRSTATCTCSRPRRSRR